jgi:hypothetical protein
MPLVVALAKQQAFMHRFGSSILPPTPSLNLPMQPESE